MKYFFLTLVALVITTFLRAEYLNIKLLNDREELVRGAKLYWKYPNYQEYWLIGTNGGGSAIEYPNLQRLRGYTNTFNYRFGKSSNPDRQLDIKIIAPGYEVYKWSQTWPASRPEFKVIELTKLKAKYHDKKSRPQVGGNTHSLQIPFNENIRKSIRWPTSNLSAFTPLVASTRNGVWAYNLYDERQKKREQFTWKFMNENGSTVTTTHRNEKYGMVVVARVVGSEIHASVTFP